MIGPGAAWRAGWRAFRHRPEQVLVPILVAGFTWVVAEVVVQSAISATVTRSHPCVRRLGDLIDPTHCAATGDRSTNGLILTTLGFCFLGQLFWAVALHAADRVLSPGVPRRPPVLPVLGTAAVLAVLLTLGIGTGFLLAVLVAFLGQSAMAGVVVERHGVMAALGQSVREVIARPGYAFGFGCLAVLSVVGGAALLLVGVWPAIAILALAQVADRRSRAAGPEIGSVSDSR